MVFPHFLTPKTQKSGYPTVDLMQLLKTKSSLDYLAERFKNSDYKKDSDSVIKELEYLKSINVFNGPNMNRIVSSDAYCDEVYRICGTDYKDKHKKLLDNLLLFCFRLSYHYQRPRPHVACMLYGIPVSPVMSEWLVLPSYPNCFLVGAKLLMLVNNDKAEPQKIKDAAMNYLKAGWHYPSDNVFSYQIADSIFTDNFFKEKIVKQ